MVWDYATSSSNYLDLRQMAYDASGGFAWLTEASRGYAPYTFRDNVLNLVNFLSETQHGYLSTPEKSSYELATEDMATLFAGMDPYSVTLTRLRAELSRPALGTDLLVGASADQSQVQNIIQTTKYVGSKPACAPPPECDGASSSSAGGGANGGSSVSGGGGCAFGQGPIGAFGGGALVALGLVAARWRRRSRSAAGS